MALQSGGVVLDQNLNVPYKEGSVDLKTNAPKATRKGGLGGRMPLGDLSNSLKPSLNQTSMKQNSSIFSINEKGTGASHIALGASKKKLASKASGKAQTGGRKALSDISNSGMPHPKEASKKNHKAKLSALAEESEHPGEILKERFLHNHQECIKAQTQVMNIDQFLQTVGLDMDFSEKLATPWAHSKAVEVKAETSLKHLALEEMSEQLTEDLSWKYRLSSKLDSPLPYRTPMSPKHCMQWEDLDHINFKLIETPELPKH